MLETCFSLLRRRRLLAGALAILLLLPELVCGWSACGLLLGLQAMLLTPQAMALEPGKPLAEYRRQSWQSDSGLPQNTVYAVLQTRDGFLWMATEAGLVRFDGFDFLVFDTSNTPQFHSNFVESLMEDRSGSLWIGTSDGLVRLRNGQFKAFTTADGLPSNAVSGLYEQSSGRLIVATAAGLAAAAAGSATAAATGSAAVASTGSAAAASTGSDGKAGAGGERFQEIAGTGALSNADTVSVLAEDAHGVLWAGGGQVLLRVRPGAVAADQPLEVGVGSIHAIAADEAGDVWVGGDDGLECFRGSQRCAEEEASGGPVTGGMAAGRILPDRISGQLPSRKVTALLRAKQDGAGGQMWVGTAAGLALMSGGKLRQVGARQGLASAGIEKLFADQSGTLWVVYRGGLARMVGGKVEVAPEQTSAGGVLSLFEDREGDLWLGTEAAGVTVLRDQPFTSITTQQGLSADFVRAVFQDHAGAIWMGTDKGGLDRMEGGKISVLRASDGLVSNVVLALAETGAKETGAKGTGTNEAAAGQAGTAETAAYLWVGTPDGLMRIPNGRMGRATGQPTGQRTGQQAGKRTDTPAGTGNGLREAGTQLFTTEDGLADNFVRSLLADRDGSLWVGTRNGLSHWTAGAGIGSGGNGSGGSGSRGTFRTYSTKDGLGSDVIGSILRTRSGVLWVGTLGGLSRMQDGKFVNFTRRDGLGGDAVTALFEDSEGTLWVGTNDNSLTRYRGGRFTQLAARKTGLPETVYGVLEDQGGGVPGNQGGNLWLSSRKGVWRVALASLNAFADQRAESLAQVSYGAADGMRISECSSGGHPSAWRMRDGTLWFATLKGVAWVNPQTSSQAVPAPPVAIEKVMLDDAEAKLTGAGTEGAGAEGAGTQGAGTERTGTNQAGTDGAGTELLVPAGRGRIAIHYAGLSFQAPQKVRYRYMLRGFDRHWIDTGENRTAYYTNVPPGRYRFLVEASNQGGVWSSPAELPLRVQPRFFQTVWFYLLMGTLLAEMGYLVYRFRVHTVEAKYKAVMAERGRIAREIHDTLAQGYVGISVQLEVASRLLQSSQGAMGERREQAGVQAEQSRAQMEQNRNRLEQSNDRLEQTRQQLEQTKELVRSSLAEARSSIWELRSQGEEAGVLPSRIAASAKRKEYRGGPAIALQVHGTHRPLPRRMEDQILRIAEEAIHNAVRHAKATRIAVMLTYDAKSLQLSVVDDGQGFNQRADALAENGHFGLQGMRERAESIGALLRVDGGSGRDSGRGTEVTLKVNVPRDGGKGDVQA